MPLHEQSNLVALDTPPRLEDIAADVRRELAPLLAKIIEIQNRANASGLHVGFSLGRDALGRNHVVSVDIIRPF